MEMENAKRKFVSDIAAGDGISDVFVLAEKSMAHKRDGNPFLNVVLADNSGQIKGVIWDNVTQIASGVAAGDFVRITAQAGEYRGMLQLVVKSMSPVSAADVAPEDFLPASARDADKMFERLKAVTDSITSPGLRSLMDACWNDTDLVRRFKRAPAAKKMHHAYLGGLIEHTLSMALLADKVAGHYSGVDRDLLIVGAVLHDMGKIRELTYDVAIDYTDEGRLLSHITIGLEIVQAKIQSLPEISPEQAALVKHMIVSHHGAREFGSPEPPKTIEAVLLNYIDEIDSRVNGIREFMAADDPDASWTAYHRLLERQFYRGNNKKAGEKKGWG
jgi:3'-5' exoribonuclease